MALANGGGGGNLQNNDNPHTNPNPNNLRLIRELRAAIVITLLSLLEGRSDTIIHERLLQELSIDGNLIEVHGYFVQHYEVGRRVRHAWSVVVVVSNNSFSH